MQLASCPVRGAQAKDRDFLPRQHKCVLFALLYLSLLLFPPPAPPIFHAAAAPPPRCLSLAFSFSLISRVPIGSLYFFSPPPDLTIQVHRDSRWDEARGSLV